MELPDEFEEEFIVGSAFFGTHTMIGPEAKQERN